MIPEWMKEKADAGLCECSAVYHGKKSFIGRTIEEIFEFIETAFFAESYSRRKGLLQEPGPRESRLDFHPDPDIRNGPGHSDLRLLIFVYMLTLLFSYLSKMDTLFFASSASGSSVPIFARQHRPSPWSSIIFLARGSSNLLQSV